VLSSGVRVDVSKLNEDARYRVLMYVVERYSRKRVLGEAGMDRVTLQKLEKVSPVKPEYVKPLLNS